VTILKKNPEKGNVVKRIEDKNIGYKSEVGRPESEEIFITPDFRLPTTLHLTFLTLDIPGFSLPVRLFDGKLAVEPKY